MFQKSLRSGRKPPINDNHDWRDGAETGMAAVYAAGSLAAALVLLIGLCFA